MEWTWTRHELEYVKEYLKIVILDSQATTQIWLLLEFYENLVFLTAQSALSPNLFIFFFFRLEIIFRVLSIYLKKEFLWQIGEECTLGCQKYQIFIKKVNPSISKEDFCSRTDLSTFTSIVPVLGVTSILKLPCLTSIRH